VNLVSTNPPNWNGGIRQTITENTTENTTKTTLTTNTAPRETPTFDQFHKAWNDIANKHGLARILSGSNGWKKKLTTRLKEKPFRENWQEALKYSQLSDFLMGKSKGGNGWKMTVDFFLREEMSLKILSGEYHNGKPAAEQKPQYKGPSFQEVLDTLSKVDDEMAEVYVSRLEHDRKTWEVDPSKIDTDLIYQWKLAKGWK
jgi:hypothetical protein